MAIEIIEISGFKLRKLSNNSYETENENLDFYFERNEEGEIDTFIFDKKLKNNDAFIHSFTEPNLDEAIITAMNYQ